MRRMLFGAPGGLVMAGALFGMAGPAMAGPLISNSYGQCLVQGRSEGVEIVDARPVRLAEGRASTWTVFRIHLRSQGLARQVQVCLVDASENRWSRSASLPAAQTVEVDVAAPESALTTTSATWGPEEPVDGAPPGRPGYQDYPGGNLSNAGTIPVKAIQVAVTSEGRAVATGGILWTEKTDPQFRGALCLMVGTETGEMPNSRSRFVTIPAADLAAVGAYPECLDSVEALCLPAGQDADYWTRLPGMSAWLKAGGLLIVQRPGPVSWRRFGAGTIASDPSIPSTAELDQMLISAEWSSDGTNALGITRFVAAGAYSPLCRYDGPYYQLGAMRALVPPQKIFPRFDVPTRPVFILAVVYLVLLLPGNYLLLRKLRRKEASWATLPAIAALFTVGIWGVCLVCKGIAPQAARIAFVEETGPGIYTGIGQLAVFSGTSRQYDARFPAGSLVHLTDLWPDLPQMMGASTTVQSEDPDGTSVQGFTVPQWASRTLSYGFTPPIEGAIVGQASCLGASGAWSLNIRNHSSLSLIGCQFREGGHAYSLPDLPASGSCDVASTAALSLAKYDRDKPLPTVERRIRFQVGGYHPASPWGATRTTGPYFIGWTSQPVQSVSVSGVASCEDQTMVIIPLEVVAGRNGLNLPDDTLRRSNTPLVGDDSPFMGQRYGESPLPTDPGGQAVCLPSSAWTHPSSSLIVTGIVAGSTPRNLLVYRSGRWQTNGVLRPGKPLVIQRLGECMAGPDEVSTKDLEAAKCPAVVHLQRVKLAGSSSGAGPPVGPTPDGQPDIQFTLIDRGPAGNRDGGNHQ